MAKKTFSATSKHVILKPAARSGEKIHSPKEHQINAAELKASFGGNKDVADALPKPQRR
jgi:hypothetical protein